MKPGKQSTEFWLILSFVATFLANGSMYINIPWEQFPVLAGVVGVYAGGRSWVKTKGP